jgi:hypothetical protein
MGADPWAARRDIAQHRVQGRAGPASAERIDPDEDSVNAQELLAHLFGERFVINRRLDLNAERRQFLEDL